MRIKIWPANANMDAGSLYLTRHKKWTTDKPNQMVRFSLDDCMGLFMHANEI